jgi:hypothetical protein
MGDRAWAARAQQLAALAGGGGGARVPRGCGHGPLRDWLEHQKGLLALGARGAPLSRPRSPVPVRRKRPRQAGAPGARSARAALWWPTPAQTPVVGVTPVGVTPVRVMASMQTWLGSAALMAAAKESLLQQVAAHARGCMSRFSCQ